MASNNTHNLVAVISKPRLKKYLDEAKKCCSSSDEQMNHALRLYAWNTALCAAFYGPIQALEIALRNEINQQLINKFGKEWYELKSGIQFDKKALTQIKEAKNNLKKHKKNIMADNIVAKLSLGFWVNLFNKRYNESLWRKIDCKSFPDNERDRKKIQERQIGRNQFFPQSDRPS
jgi:hypothetical protein